MFEPNPVHFALCVLLLLVTIACTFASGDEAISELCRGGDKRRAARCAGFFTCNLLGLLGLIQVFIQDLHVY
jgi:hypothetical protein